ncbi:MAG: type II toxin-antitoxin system RelE/ParE family toxin [Gammaproteobacteria bacterium]|nr:type II toxin-antitoxin system RelE/ParE family toxin [Gammaproteobacteria bacterium]
MIKNFRHKGIKQFFETGSKKGIQSSHAEKLSRQLTRLNRSTKAEDMNLPGWKLHQLKSDMKQHWSVTINGNWRLTFTFKGNDAVLVDY